MTRHTKDRADAVFVALANVTRRAMLRRLAAHNLSIGNLSMPLHMTLAAASKHVKVLERAGLVERHDWGWSHLCILNRDALRPVRDWLDELDE